MFSQNKSLHFGQYVPNDQILNKKIQGNPKYQHVKPAIDTGYSVRRHIDELRDKQLNCLQRKDEVFKRIKFANFIELLIESAKVKLKSEYSVDGNSKEVDESSLPVKKSRGLANVIMGIGEIDLANQRQKEASISVQKIEKEYPYLLLDVRDKEYFLMCHIKTAKHYPSALLTRSIGYETEELKLYKNSSLEVIIVYDDDESIASRVSTTLVQRGYDNVFLLTGGLKYISESFPRKPMSSLCNRLPPDPNRSSSPTVQVKNISVEFSQEDVDIIEQYTDNTRKDFDRYHPRSSSRSKSEENPPESKPPTASLTYRRDSNSSSKSIEEARTKILQSANNDRFKGAKKVPWK